MRKRPSLLLAPLVLAGAALVVAPAAADVVHHPAAHAHPAFHRPAFRSVAHSAYRAGPFRGAGHFGRAGFRPLHAALLRHVSFARFTPAERAAWIHGNWYHRWYNGRYGWWWYAGGAWFWYGAPVYPYPTVVSDYYYEPQDSNQTGAYYCYNPPGYFPNVQNCYGQWQPVPAQGYGGYDQSGPDQGPPPGGQYDNEQGPSPGEQGPPPGYGQGPYDQGPPPGYGQGPYDQRPPSGYQGPPPGYEQGPPPGNEQGPPNPQEPQ